jgi:hypothetical protein
MPAIPNDFTVPDLTQLALYDAPVETRLWVTSENCFYVAVANGKQASNGIVGPVDPASMIAWQPEGISVTLPDGTSAVVSNSSETVALFRAPLGGGADDWADLNAFMAASAASGIYTVEFSIGTYVVYTPGLVPNGMTVRGRTGTIIDDRIDPAGNGGAPTQALFMHPCTHHATTTLLASSALEGASTISVASITAPPIAKGSIVQVTRGFDRAQIYEVIATPSGVGPFVLTLDRPLADDMPIGEAPYVSLVLDRPERITIEHNGMKIIGTTANMGHRIHEFIGGYRVYVIGARIDTGATIAIGGSCDVGSLLSSYIDCEMTTTSTVSVCWMLESCQYCTLDKCRGVGSAAAIYLTDSMQPTINQCTGYGSSVGLHISSQSAISALGAKGVHVIGGDFAKCTYGVLVEHGALDTLLDGTRSAYNTTNNFWIRSTVSAPHRTKLRNTISIGDWSTPYSGIQVGPGITGIRIESHRDQATAYAIKTESSISIDGFTSNDGACAFQMTGAGTTEIKNFNITIPTGNGLAAVMSDVSGARVRLKNGTITVPTAGIGIDLLNAGSIMELENVTLAGLGAGGIGANGVSGAQLTLKGTTDLGNPATFFAAALIGSTTIVQVGGVAAKTVTTSDVTMTLAECYCTRVSITGALTGNRSLILKHPFVGATYTVSVATTEAYTITFKGTSSDTGVVVAQGKTAMLQVNSTGAIVRLTADI